MEYVLKFLYDFVLLFLLFLIVYLVFINKRKKDYSKLKKSDFTRIFIIRYDLDMRKTDYKKVLRLTAIINSFIIAFTSTLILNIDNFLWKVVISFIVIFTLIYALYELTGRYLKKKEVEKKDV